MKIFTLKTRRNIQACVIAPFSVFPAVGTLLLGLYLYSLTLGEKVATTGLSVAYLLVFYGWLIAVFATLFYGLPVALVLQKLGKFRLIFLLPCSLVPSLIIFFTNINDAGLSLLYGYCSVWVAFSYWTLFNRPDT
ncbi:hypothetical protein [Paraglaciecola sp. 2405UD69-4]|uniref:hypothetical protein n=1 Tax=Paraglaciecola sp. 2405UD69-4 TaxID=3391836 RepID=UPI0039C9509A